MTSPIPDPPVSVREIADLLAWTRRLSEAGRHADPAEKAAFHVAKTALFTRLGHTLDDADEPATENTR